MFLKIKNSLFILYSLEKPERKSKKRKSLKKHQINKKQEKHKEKIKINNLIIY